MKRWFLAIWYKIMRKYANHQIKELQMEAIKYLRESVGGRRNESNK